MAHTQHGDKERKKRKHPCAPIITVHSGTLVVAASFTDLMTTTYCVAYPVPTPWDPPGTIQLTPFPSVVGAPCAWRNTFVDAGGATWDLNIDGNTATPELDGWLMTIGVTPPTAPHFPYFWLGQWSLPPSPTPAGTFNRDNSGSGGSPCQDPATITVTIP